MSAGYNTTIHCSLLYLWAPITHSFIDSFGRSFVGLFSDGKDTMMDQVEKYSLYNNMMPSLERTYDSVLTWCTLFFGHKNLPALQVQPLRNNQLSMNIEWFKRELWNHQRPLFSISPSPQNKIENKKNAIQTFGQNAYGFLIIKKKQTVLLVALLD